MGARVVKSGQNCRIIQQLEGQDPVSDNTNHAVTFHLTGGADIDIDMTSKELESALRSVDRDGLVGTINCDHGTQVWVRGRHVVGVTYPLETGVDWIAIRAQGDEPPKRWEL